MANDKNERGGEEKQVKIAGLLTYQKHEKNAGAEKAGECDELIEAVKLLVLAREDERRKDEASKEAWRVRIEREEDVCAIARRTLGWGTPGGSRAGQDGEEVRG